MKKQETSVSAVSNILISKCSCFHWREIVSVYTEAFPELSSSDISWYLRKFKKSTFVAWQDKKIVGFCLYSYDKTPGVVFLEHIGVKKDKRNCGIGSILLEHLIQKVQQEGCGEIKLTALKKNVSAIRYYEKNGFKKLSDGGPRKFVYSRKIIQLKSNTKCVVKNNSPSYGIAGKIYWKIVYFFLVELF